MTKKHFELIADILKDNAPYDKDRTMHIDNNYINLCISFSDRLAQVNPRFQKDRFLVACGVKEQTKKEFLI